MVSSELHAEYLIGQGRTPLTFSRDTEVQVKSYESPFITDGFSKAYPEVSAFLSLLSKETLLDLHSGFEKGTTPEMRKGCALEKPRPNLSSGHSVKGHVFGA
jgi:hypothetical protein